AKAGRLPQQESVAKRVVGLGDELGLARVVRPAADLDRDRVTTAERQTRGDPSREDGAGDALKPSLAPQADLAPRSLQGDPRRHARAGRTAVHLPVGEDA